MKKTNKILALVIAVAMIFSMMSVLPIVGNAEDEWLTADLVGMAMASGVVYEGPYEQSAVQGSDRYLPYAVYNSGVTADAIRFTTTSWAVFPTGNTFSAAKVYVDANAWSGGKPGGAWSLDNATEISATYSAVENGDGSYTVTYSFSEAVTGKTFIIEWGSDEGGHLNFATDNVKVKRAASRPIDFASAGGVWQSSIDASTYGAASLDVDPGQQYIAGYSGVICLPDNSNSAEATIFNLGENGGNYCLKGGYVWYTFNAPQAGTYTFAFKVNSKTGTPRAFNFGIDCDPADASTQYQAISDENFRNEAWAVIDIDLTAGDHTLYVLTATDFDDTNGPKSVEIKHVAVYSPVPADEWYTANLVGMAMQSGIVWQGPYSQSAVQGGDHYNAYAVYNDGVTANAIKFSEDNESNATGNTFTAAKVYVDSNAWPGGTPGPAWSLETAVEIPVTHEVDGKTHTYIFDSEKTGKTFIIVWGSDNGGHLNFDTNNIKVGKVLVSEPETPTAPTTLQPAAGERIPVLTYSEGGPGYGGFAQWPKFTENGDGTYSVVIENGNHVAGSWTDQSSGGQYTNQNSGAVTWNLYFPRVYYPDGVTAVELAWGLMSCDDATDLADFEIYYSDDAANWTKTTDFTVYLYNPQDVGGAKDLGASNGSEVGVRFIFNNPISAKYFFAYDPDPMVTNIMHWPGYFVACEAPAAAGPETPSVYTEYSGNVGMLCYNNSTGSWVMGNYFYPQTGEQSTIQGEWKYDRVYALDSNSMVNVIKFRTNPWVNHGEINNYDRAGIYYSSTEEWNAQATPAASNPLTTMTSVGYQVYLEQYADAYADLDGVRYYSSWVVYVLNEPVNAKSIFIDFYGADESEGSGNLFNSTFIVAYDPDPQIPAPALPTLVASIADEEGGDKIDHLYLNAAISASEERTVGIIFSNSEDSCKHVTDGGNPLFIRKATEGHGRSSIGFIESACYGSAVITAANLGGEDGDSVLALYWQDMPTEYEVLYARVFAINEDGTYEYGAFTTIELTDGTNYNGITA